MVFFRLCIILACYIFSSLCNTSNAETVVVYEGPAVVHESEQFSLTCFANHFANFKWRQNDSNTDFENSENYSQVQAHNETLQFSSLTIKSTLLKHTGNYKCSYESDDYGHNLTVNFADCIPSAENSKCCKELLIASGIKLTASFDRLPCPQGSTALESSKCVLGVMYHTLTLTCRSDPSLNDSLTLTWYKSDKSSKEGEKWLAVTESNRIKLSGEQLHIVQFLPGDVGNYKCKVTFKGQEKQELAPLVQSFLQVQALPVVVPTFKDLTVVEENTINVTCTVIGQASRILWRFGDTILKNGSNNRVELREFNGVQDATLLIKNANTTTDRGAYNCTAESVWGNSSNFALCYVRVKSKYAALVPFLGICAEVIILCTIILIYEKKRDKTELEESDTDQGPETKSSPDHGQDSVRYRK